MLHVVGDFSLFANTPLQVPRTRKVPRATGQQNNVKVATVVVDPALNKRPVSDGHDPVITCRGSQAALKLPCQKVIPRVGFIERGRWKWFGSRGEKILLQTPREIVGVCKIEILG